jgi:hypothetical protein
MADLREGPITETRAVAGTIKLKSDGGVTVTHPSHRRRAAQIYLDVDIVKTEDLV